MILRDAAGARADVSLTVEEDEPVGEVAPPPFNFGTQWDLFYNLCILLPAAPSTPFFFFFTRVTGPRRSLSLKLSDARVYAPQIRARLGTTPRFWADASLTVEEDEPVGEVDPPPFNSPLKPGRTP